MSCNGTGGNVLFDTRITGALVEPGGAVWVGTLPPHAVENVGASEIRFLNLELKRYRARPTRSPSHTATSPAASVPNAFAAA
jgi:hypothetical protein